MNETEIREEPQAGSPLCDADGHAWVWTWPIEGGEGSVGQCSLCGRITTAERDAAARAEVARLREAVERAQALVDTAGVVAGPFGPPQRMVHAPALAAALAPVVPSGEAESGEADEVERRRGDVHHWIEPTIGHLRLVEHDGESLSPQSIHGVVTNLRRALAAADGKSFAEQQAVENSDPAPVSSRGEADGEREAANRAEAEVVRFANDLCAAAHDNDSGVSCQECYGLACEVLDAPAFEALVADRVAAALAARPVLSREALRAVLVGHQATAVMDGLKCSCDTTTRSSLAYADHLADVLAGEQR